MVNSLNETYCAACHAPICSGQLFHDLGHLADTTSAEALLRGDYTFPEECDQATEAILREIVLIFSKQQSPMNIRIEPNDFHWWRKVLSYPSVITKLSLIARLSRLYR